MVRMTKKIDYSTINLENLYDWCEQFLHFFDVSVELSDVGIVVEEVERKYEEAVEVIKELMDECEYD